MRPLRIEFPTHPIKPPLLLAAASPPGAWSSLAGASGETARAAHSARDAPDQSDPAESPASTTRPPNATAAPPPWSQTATRCPSAAPAAAHTRETSARTRAARPRSLGATMRQHNTKRLHASATVNGSQRVPSAVRNHPLKSAVQTSLGACAAAKRLGQRDNIARATTRLTQPGPPQQIAHRAGRRPDARAASRSGKHRPQFLGPPARMRAPQRHDRRPGCRSAIARPCALRRPRSLRQARAPDPPRSGPPICSRSCRLI